MATEELTLRIRGDIRDIRRDFRTVEQDGDQLARRVGDSFEHAGRRISGAFRTLRTGAFATGAAAVGFGVLAQRSLAAAENIQDLADRANVSTEFLQELRIITSQSGAETRDFDDAISRLNRRLGLFQQYLATGTGEMGPAAQAFRALGLESQIVDGRLATSEQAFNAAVEALQNVESASRRAAISSQLFGEDAGPRLVGLLDRGSEGIAEFRAELQASGEIMSNDTVASASAASDALERVQQKFSAEFNQAIAQNADELVTLGEALGNVAAAAVRATAALAGMFRDPEGVREIREEIEAVERRLTTLRTGGGRVDQIPDLERRLAELQTALQSQIRFDDFREWWESQSGSDSDDDSDDDGSGGGLSAASIPTPRVNPRTLDAAAKAQALAEFAATAKEIGQRIADETAAELERENQRIADTFGRGAADGVISALDGNLDQFLARMFRQAAFNGLSDAFSSFAGSIGGGSGGGFLGGLARFGVNLLGGGKATGGPARGLTLVGEQGPELVNLGAMANVMTANMTRMALAGRRAAAPSAPGQQIVNLQTTVVDQSRGVDVSVRQISEREIAVMIDERAPRAVAGQLENQNSPVARSMRSNFQITPRRGNV